MIVRGWRRRERVRIVLVIAVGKLMGEPVTTLLVMLLLLLSFESLLAWT